MEEKFRNGDIAFWLAAAFLFGIFAASEDWDMRVVSMAAPAPIIILLFFSRSSVVWKYVTAIFLSGLLGIFYYHGYVHWMAIHTHLPAGKDAAFLGSVTDEPEHAGNFILLKVALSRPYSGAIDIFTSPNSESENFWVHHVVYFGYRQNVEDFLATQISSIHSNIMKVSFPISGQAEGESFVRNIGPKIIIVTPGIKTLESSPSKALIASLVSSTAALILRTDVDGTIGIVSSGGTLHISKGK